MSVMTPVDRPDNVRCFKCVPTGIVGDNANTVYTDLGVSAELGVPRSPSEVLVQVAGSMLAHPSTMYLSMGVRGLQISDQLAFLLGITEDGQPVPEIEIIFLQS